MKKKPHELNNTIILKNTTDGTDAKFQTYPTEYVLKE